MTPENLLNSVIVSTLTSMGLFSDRAALMVLAIPIQETGLRTRVQVGSGIAHSFWQFELGSSRGGLIRLFSHCTAGAKLIAYADAAGLPFDAVHCYDMIATEAGDNYACACARALLLADGAPLPAVGDDEGAWKCYLRNWNPGDAQRHPLETRKRWTQSYAQALDALESRHGT